MAMTKERFIKLRKKGLSIDQIHKFERGEKPTTQPKQPEQDLVTGFGVGALKGAGSTLESGLRSAGQIVGGIGGAMSVPIQEKKQADLTTQYEQALQSKQPELARQLQQQISQAGQPTKAWETLFDNPFLAKAREALKPKTTAEKVGYGTEKIGEYFIPGGIQKKLAGKAGILGRALAQGTGAAGIKLAQTGVGTGEKGEAYDRLKESLKTGAIAGAFSAGTELVMKGISSFLAKAGPKIQTISIKPNARDLKDGFKVSNIKKYDLGGTLKQSLGKVNDRLNESRKAVQSIIKKSDIKIELNNVIKEVDKKLETSTVKHFGSNKQLMKAFEDMYDDLVSITKGKSKINMLTAQDIKIGAGTQGSWQFGKFDQDSRAKEYVYNLFYDSLKKTIEKATPKGEIHLINKAMSELIPIKNALIKRLPVAARKNPLGLLEGIALIQSLSSGSLATLPFIAAKGITGSSKAGAAMIDIAGSLTKSQPKVGGMLAKFISGLR